uniref:hypothetical protein n=1 Tax=Gluconobacter thailandicus TaxID=257438 RepID=UPI000ADF4135|nr:hypothetical protein [Gluconobacter thailandicus]
MNEFQIGQRVIAATMRGKEEFEGEIHAIETKLRGAWYHIKRDIDGVIIKVRAAKMRIA